MALGVEMNRNEWKAAHRHLRKLLRERPKLEACSVSVSHGGKDWTARLCRCPNCNGLDIKPAMIRQRHSLMRQADEWRWVSMDRNDALRKLRYRTDRTLILRGYRRGIEFLRDLRLNPTGV